MVDQAKLIHDNRNPDCVFMKIDLRNGESDEAPVAVLLGINFGGTQEKHFKVGTVWYELKHGSLRIKLQGAKAPYDLRHIDGRIEAQYKAKREVETIHDDRHIDEKSGSKGLILGADQKGAKSNFSVGEALKSTTEHGGTRKLKETFEHTDWLITTKGSEEEPIWDFRPMKGSHGLLGYIRECLCEITTSTKPCFLDATFEISTRDITIVDVSGLWPESLTQIKKKVLKRYVEWIIAKELSPFVSKHQVRHG